MALDQRFARSPGDPFTSGSQGRPYGRPVVCVRRLAVLLLAVLMLVPLLAVTACSSPTGRGDAGDGDGDGDGSSHAGVRSCDGALDDALSAWEDAGFDGSVAVTSGRAPVCVGGYGRADAATGRPDTADTVFSIGSVSKAFTAALVLDLVERGRLSLDETAGDVVPDLSGPAATVTVRQLLLHTSGLTGAHGADHEPLDHDGAVSSISRLALAFPPGSDFGYSNAGYTLLALIIEERSGTTYRRAMADVMLDPAGLDSAGFWDGEPAARGPRAVGEVEGGPTDEMGGFEGPHWALDGNGDLAMTMGDLATWTRALFAGDLVGEASVDLIASPGFDHGDGTGESPGWVVVDAARYGEPLLVTAGGGGDVGHDVVVAWLPISERVIALASNTSDVTAEQLLQAIGPAWVAGDPLPRPDAPSAELDPTRAAEVAGTYVLGTGGSFEVSAGDAHLDVAAVGADAVTALLPLPDGVSDDEVAAHEAGVVALLAGATDEGRDERAVLEEDLGEVQGVELAGTVFADGELRTYVTVRGRDGSWLLWYAVDDHGAIAAAEGPTDPPHVVVLPDDSGIFRPDDPAGLGPDVALRFDGPTLTVTGPGTSTTARSTS